MSNILVFLEQINGKLLKSSLVAINAASQLKSAWSKSALLGICLGPNAAQAAQSALTYGMNSVIYSEEAQFEKYRALAFSQAVLQVFKQEACDTFVGCSTSSLKDFSARVAAALEAGQASDILAINPDGSLKRPMFAGNVIADVEINSALKVVTVRSTAFSPAAASTVIGSVKAQSFNLDLSKAGEVISYDKPQSTRPELADAEIIVSGGRALKSAENFMQYMGQLADSLGAAIGASRAAVDSGYAPNDWQVGQTGKVVAPNLYIACGISGAIQHIAGMKDSKVIVAINKDPDCPIFEVADYGLVADLFEVVPALTAEIKKVRAN